VEHPEDKPELDWWYGQRSPSGNKLLINAVRALCEWIPSNFDIDVFHFPYFIEQGGKACPQHAFDEPIYSPETYNQAILPGRDGRYSRPTCHIQIRKDSHEAEEQVPAGFFKPVKVLKFCRNCEWRCPVGK
jgi:hypothetical protein